MYVRNEVTFTPEVNRICGCPVSRTVFKERPVEGLVIPGDIQQYDVSHIVDHQNKCPLKNENIIRV